MAAAVAPQLDCGSYSHTFLFEVALSSDSDSLSPHLPTGTVCNYYARRRISLMKKQPIQILKLAV
ncbi:MAG: hypothetical protein RID07_09155, partial [Lacipirellulaceae bacterium]